MYALAKQYFPGDYVKRLRLRMPWFLGLTEADPFPRVAIGNRILRRSGAQFGPFPSRDSAQRYEVEVAGLFQLRRCVERLAPYAEHPGCMYGEMNQCLRPCQCAVTSEEYASEVRRVADFLSTNGRSAVALLSAARERACEATDFEAAAQIHNRIERTNTAAAERDEVIRDVEQFNGIALTRGTENRQFRLWPMIQGFWQEPVTLDFGTEEAGPKSLDEELRQRVSGALEHVDTERNRIEDLAIFSRWYFSSFRDGQWFAFRSIGDLNYRRLVREISKMAKTVPGDSV